MLSAPFFQFTGLDRVSIFPFSICVIFIVCLRSLWSSLTLIHSSFKGSFRRYCSRSPLILKLGSPWSVFWYASPPFQFLRHVRHFRVLLTMFRFSTMCIGTFELGGQDSRWKSSTPISEKCGGHEACRGNSPT